MVLIVQQVRCGVTTYNSDREQRAAMCETWVHEIHTVRCDSEKQDVELVTDYNHHLQPPSASSFVRKNEWKIMSCLLSCAVSSHVPALSRARATRPREWTDCPSNSGQSRLSWGQRDVPSRLLSARVFLCKVRSFQSLRGGDPLSRIIGKQLLSEIQRSRGHPPGRDVNT